LQKTKIRTIDEISEINQIKIIFLQISHYKTLLKLKTKKSHSKKFKTKYVK